jgi:hypothetical protein
MKVARGLLALGWTTETLPSSLNPTWGGLIRALRSNGVSVDKAASELDRALQGQYDSIEFISEHSGQYGLLFFGTPEQWRPKCVKPFI